MNTSKYCQSCGYPLSRDKEGGRSEADGSINTKYCSMCYKDGRFLTPPEVDTAAKMQEFCIKEMKKDGTLRPSTERIPRLQTSLGWTDSSGLLAWVLTRGIPKLERWKNL